MKVRWLLVSALLIAAAGCSSTPNWGEYLRDHLPRESPRMAVARFQFALAYGPTRDAFESLTGVSRGVIGYTRWWLFMPYAKDPETGEKLLGIARDSKIDFCYETEKKNSKGQPTAQASIFYEKTRQGYTIEMAQEGEEWKVALVETFLPGKAREYEEERRKEEEEKEKGSKPAP